MRHLLSQNGFLKLLSISMAILLWIFVNTETDDVTGREVSRTFDGIEVDVRNQDENLVILEEPEPVSATLRGTRTMLDRSDENDLVFYVNLEGLEEGTHQVSVSSGVPQFEVTEIQPQEVEVTLDEQQEETFPVDSVVTGTPSDGLQEQEPEITPQNITISGARTYIEQIDNVVAQIDVDEATESLEKGLVVDIYDEEGETIEDVDVTPGMVEVYVPMDYPEKDVDIELDVDDNVDDYYLTDLEISPEQVTIGGGESAIEGIDNLNTDTVELDRLLQEETVVLDLDVPEGVKEISESSVVVTGVVLPAEEESFDLPVELPGQLTEDEEIDPDLDPDQVTVTFSGEQQAIQELSEEDLTAYLDIQEDVEIGEDLELEVTVDYPENDIELVDIDPPQVNLNTDDE